MSTTTTVTVWGVGFRSSSGIRFLRPALDQSDARDAAAMWNRIKHDHRYVAIQAERTIIETAWHE